MFNLPHWAATKISIETARYFKIYSSVQDGNCFFDSVRIILSQTLPQTIAQIRYVVALPVRDVRNDNITETIKNWIQLYQDALKENTTELKREYQHVAGVTLPLTDHGRDCIFYSMMQSSYWGEEHACRIVEETYNIRFLIFDGDYEKFEVNHSYYSPTYNHGNQLDYCFIYKANSHYMPVLFQDKSKWKWEQLPREVQLLFSPPAQN